MVSNLVLPFDPPAPFIEIDLDGSPVTQGSKRAINHRTTGRAVVIESADRNLKFWRGRVAEMASVQMGDRALLAGRETALAVEVWFTLHRPPSVHRRITMPGSRPDLDKLGRAIGDALKGIVYADDGQVCDLLLHKRYVGHPQARVRPGARIVVRGYGI